MSSEQRFSMVYSIRRLTGDDPGQDLPIPEASQECVYLAFPIMGGEFRSAGSTSDARFQIFKPEFFPHVTERRVCFGVCAGFSSKRKRRPIWFFTNRSIFFFFLYNEVVHNRTFPQSEVFRRKVFHKKISFFFY